MKAPAISLLIDARHSPTAPPPAPAGVEVVVAGPGRAVDLPAEAPEARVFFALVEASTAPLCIWQRHGDQPTPDRLALLARALVRLQVPIVAHLPPSARQAGSGRILRLPGPVVTRGNTVHPDTLAFRREVAAFAPPEDQHRHGTRRALLNWAATRDGVGWVDRALLQRPPRPKLPLEVDIQRRIIGTRASFAALSMLQDLEAPNTLVEPALQHLLDRSQDWTWTHWDLLLAHKRPRWTPPPEESA